MADAELDIKHEEGWVVYRQRTTTLLEEEPLPPSINDLVDHANQLSDTYKTPHIDIKFKLQEDKIIYKVIWLRGDKLIRKPVPERPVKDILQEPFSRIITQEETEFVIVSEEPSDQEGIQAMGETYLGQFSPTRLFYEHGTSTKITPDGELTERVIIWHAVWDNRTEESLPTLEDNSAA